MASIKERVSTSGKGFYQVQIRKSGHPTISKSFSFESEKDKEKAYKEAQKYAFITENEISNNNKKVFKNKRKDKLIEVLESYKKVEKREKHIRRLNQLIDDFSNTNYTIETFTADRLRHYLEKREEINKPATIYWLYITLKNALTYHSKEYEYKQDIFELVKYSGKSDERTRILTEEEKQTLFNTIDERLRVKKEELKLVIDFAIETALRLNEIITLEWKNVNFEDKVILIEKDKTKTKRERQVPLSKNAFEALEAMKKFKTSESNLVFHMWQTKNLLSHRFKLICDMSNIQDIRFHDLRHTAITNLYLKTDLRDREIQEISGHATMSMLQRYSNLRATDIVKKLWK